MKAKQIKLDLFGANALWQHWQNNTTKDWGKSLLRRRNSRKGGGK